MAVKLHGGQAPPTENMYKIMLLAHGLAGVGKTAFGLSFPGPFGIFNLDRGIGSLTTQLPETVEIDYEDVSLDVAVLTKGMAQQILNKMDAMVNDMLKLKQGTLIIDGWDIFWDCVKMAKVNNLDSDLPKEYAPANSYMNNLLMRLGRSPINVVFTTISSKVWSGAKTETDRMKADGFKHKDRMLTHEVYLFTPEDYRTPNEVPLGGDPTKGTVGQTHNALITMSKLNESLINRRIPNLTYKLLYRLTFGVAPPDEDKLWTPGKKAEAPKTAVAGAT